MPLSMSRFDRLQELTARQPPLWEEVLQELLQVFHCVAGTIHLASGDEKTLHLCAQQNIPEALLPMVTTIPVGKGIAGVAAERREPVQICNLQTDDSGVAKAGAKQTNMQGSIAVPVLREGRLRAVFGLGKAEPYDFTLAEEADFQAAAQLIADGIGNDTPAASAPPAP